MNPAIERDRNVALARLKPSERDLDYGLALHREAVVVESYGLGLWAPLVPDTINEAADAGASPLELQDLTEDMMMTGWSRTPELRREYRDAWAAAGVTCIMQNAGEEGNDPLRMMKRLARHTRNTDAMPDILQRVTTAADILDTHRQGKHCTLLTCNGVPLSPNPTTVEEGLLHLRVFTEFGVRMMHLTYNRRNLIGDGCGEPGNAGLSDFGRAVVREMNRLGIMIDLAHTGWRTCLEAAALSTRPVVVSHSTVHALNAHIRAKPDDVIKAVVDTGGTIGITNVPAFLGGSGDIVAMLDHIDYVVKTYGVGAVTIGTDCGHHAQGCAEAAAAVTSRGPRRTRWESLWPKGDALHAPEWQRPELAQSMAWTNWPLFTVGLVQRGYSDEDIRQIIGGNILRVAQDVWQDSAYCTA